MRAWIVGLAASLLAAGAAGSAAAARYSYVGEVDLGYVYLDASRRTLATGEVEGSLLFFSRTMIRDGDKVVAGFNVEHQLFRVSCDWRMAATQIVDAFPPSKPPPLTAKWPSETRLQVAGANDTGHWVIQALCGGWGGTEPMAYEAVVADARRREGPPPPPMPLPKGGPVKLIPRAPVDDFVAPPVLSDWTLAGADWRQVVVDKANGRALFVDVGTARVRKHMATAWVLAVSKDWTTNEALRQYNFDCKAREVRLLGQLAWGLNSMGWPDSDRLGLRAEAPAGPVTATLLDFVRP
eukprot:gene14359-14152_t